ncbi:vWA domain-containing protein [Deferrisoma camini]|uniref:vWA domain-containing protein n=1 Tax=Deferrisoma camini TaxID=1035120 RepID=UPI00046D609A|nr:VWA domain-containing protein [Deferrisoma camini]
MDFLRPWFLWGLAAAALPVLLHLLGRRRVRTVPVGTLRFLERAAARAQARWRIRRWLLLLARMLALASLTLLYAGPGCTTGGDGRGPSGWVLVLDTSPSMAAVRDGRSALDRARQALLAVVDRAGPQDRFWFLGTSARDEIQGPMDPAGARQALEAARVRAGAHDLGRALAAARAAAGGDQGAVIVVASDLQARAWPRQPVRWDGPRVPMFLVDCGWPDPVNVWIGRVAETPEGLDVGVGRVGTDATVTLRLVEPSRPARKAFVEPGRAGARFSREARPGVVELTVAPGGELAWDDRLRLPSRRSGTPRVLLVNGDPQGFELRDELLFVRKALAPDGALAGRFRVSEVRQSDLRPGDLEGVEVILAANPRPFSEDLVRALAERVAGGATLVVSAGSHLVPGTDFGPLLPAPLRDRVEVPAEDPSRPPYETLDPAGFGGFMDVFQDPGRGDLAATKVRRYWVLDIRSADGVRVLARLSGGAPVMLERRRGRGRLIFVGTTLDRDGADLCLQAGFVPWLERLVLYGAGRLRPRVPPVVQAGVPLDLPYPGTVTIEGPDGFRVLWAPGDPAPVPEAVGLYRVVTQAGTEDRFFARIDPAESDLARLEPAEAARRLGEGTVWVRPGRGLPLTGRGLPGRVDASAWAAGVVLGALLAEALLSGRWRGWAGRRRVDRGA